MTSTEDPAELIECPRSRDLWEPGSGAVVHRAPRSEIASNQGICAACASEIQRHHSLLRAGRREAPADMNEPIRSLEKLEPTAWGGLAEPILSVDFDFETIYALDEEAKEADEEARLVAFELFNGLLGWVWGRPSKSPPSKYQLRYALTRLAAFTAGLRPDLVGGATYLQLGSAIGITKQALSKSSLKCAHAFGMRFARSRPDSARANMSRARKDSYARTHSGG